MPNKRRRSFRAALSAVLLGLLIAAEAIAVAHSADLDAHVGDEPCKICLSIASFGSAAPAHAPGPLPPQSAASLVVHATAVRVPASVAVPFARGPPPLP